MDVEGMTGNKPMSTLRDGQRDYNHQKQTTKKLKLQSSGMGKVIQENFLNCLTLKIKAL